MAIHKKPLAVRYEHGASREDIFKWVFVTGGASSILVFLFVYWNRSLQK